MRNVFPWYEAWLHWTLSTHWISSQYAWLSNDQTVHWYEHYYVKKWPGTLKICVKHLWFAIIEHIVAKSVSVLCFKLLQFKFCGCTLTDIHIYKMIYIRIIVNKRMTRRKSNIFSFCSSFPSFARAHTHRYTHARAHTQTHMQTSSHIREAEGSRAPPRIYGIIDSDPQLYYILIAIR